MQEKLSLEEEERRLTQQFNSARIAKIRDTLKKEISEIHARNGTSEEIRHITHESVRKIQLIITHS